MYGKNKLSDIGKQVVQGSDPRGERLEVSYDHSGSLHGGTF